MTITAARGPQTGVAVVAQDGQSLGNYPAKPNRFMDFAMAGLGVNYAVPADDSEAWQNLSADVTTRLYPYASRAGAAQAGLVMCGGQTNLALGNSGATIYSLVSAYAVAAKANGFDWVIYLTIPESSTFTSGQNDERLDHNQLAIEDADGSFDAVLDIDPIVTLAGGDFDGTFIHFNRQGAKKVGLALRPLIVEQLA